MLPDAQNIRIAVVDDERTILKVFSSILSQAELHADFFTSAEEVIRVITMHPKRYNLLIMDIFLPSGNGVDFAKQIRTIVPDLPIMFMTGNLKPEVKEQALTLNRVMFLEKPFPLLGELREMILKFLSEK